MYPNSINDKEKDYSLQSRLFGHRMKDNQTLYEYLIEFLQVMISPKEVTGMSKPYPEDYFPIDDLIEKRGLSFAPVTRIGLKRFVFLPKSKLESKAEVDELAYNDCILALKESILLDSSLQFDKDFYINVLQNLLLGFKAVNQNRSWFDQNLLPICCEVILPESMGLKSKRKNITYRPDQAKVDNEFSYDRYTYMRRGGEVYYLHLLQSLQQNPEYKDSLEEKFQNLINQFPKFSTLTTFIQSTWERRLEPNEKKLVIKKVLGAIPQGFAKKGKYTLTELDNFLDTAIHPFEKIDILSYGIILQILRMTYLEASEIADAGDCVWIIDINGKGFENKEVRKLAINGFDSNEECINTALHKGFVKYKSDLIRKPSDNEFDIIKKAAADTFKLYRKLGKTIGLVIPPKGIGMRFSLSEKVIKFLVLAIIPPNGKVTLDTFINKLYEHYGMIIDRVQYNVEMHKGNVQHLNNLSFLESNKAAFSQKLKDCGFLRDLSDSTSIVENPYGREC